MIGKGKTGARRQRSGRKLPLLHAAASAAWHSSVIFWQERRDGFGDRGRFSVSFSIEALTFLGLIGKLVDPVTAGIEGGERGINLKSELFAAKFY